MLSSLPLTLTFLLLTTTSLAFPVPNSALDPRAATITKKTTSSPHPTTTEHTTTIKVTPHTTPPTTTHTTLHTTSHKPTPSPSAAAPVPQNKAVPPHPQLVDANGLPIGISLPGGPLIFTSDDGEDGGPLHIPILEGKKTRALDSLLGLGPRSRSVRSQSLNEVLGKSSAKLTPPKLRIPVEDAGDGNCADQRGGCGILPREGSTELPPPLVIPVTDESGGDAHLLLPVEG